MRKRLVDVYIDVDVLVDVYTFNKLNDRRNPNRRSVVPGRLYDSNCRNETHVAFSDVIIGADGMHFSR